jgi:hypothetical protein
MRGSLELNDEQAARLAQADGIKCEATSYPCAARISLCGARRKA